MEQQDLNKRLLIAFALSLIVFMAITYFFPQEQQTVQPEKKVVNTHKTPTAHTANAAPSTISSSEDKTNNAPVTNTSEVLLATITSKIFKMSIDTFGRINQFELLEEKYRNKDGENLKILGINEVKPLEVRFSDATLNDEAFKTAYTYTGASEVNVINGAQTLTFTQTLSTVTLTKKLTVEPTGAYNLEVTTSSPKRYYITPGYRPMADDSMYMLVRGALIKDMENITLTVEDGDATGNEVVSDAKIASAFDRYVASMFYNFDTPMHVSIVQEIKDGEENPLLFVEGDEKLHLGGYIGPKEHNILESINPELTDTIEFGFFTFLSRPFYKVLLWINNMVGNWGWAIILFTLLVKLILFPLSYKGMMSMQKLKDLAPKMKDIKAKYKSDPAKMNMKVMEMYKKEKANPMGGCLPMLLQIPVFFALYRVLLNADELQGAHWIHGWIENLAVADPYYILPILMGVSMWFQQKITPNNFSDPLQEKIFQWFPVLMAGMFIIMPFPSGLVLYWVVNNIFTIGQQYIINKAYQKQKKQKELV